MIIKEKQVPLWYQPTTDIQLFPIYEKDADMLLFNTVWDLVKHPDFCDFYKDVDIVGRDIAFGKDVVWLRPLLLFPSDEPCLAYIEKELIHPYIIGVFSQYLDKEYPMIGFEEGDEYPMFRVYLTPEWQFTPDAGIVYRTYWRDREDRMPQIVDNTKALKSVLEELLRYLNSVIADTGNWKERLLSSLSMLNTGTHKIFILHNAGLYDIQSLWSTLIRSGQGGEQLTQLSPRVERELHRYAMLTVNSSD